VNRLTLARHKHISMRGVLTFDLAGHRSRLLRQAPSSGENRASI
jgi:hypothetical protein